MYQSNGSHVPSSDYCMVSVSSIQDLFTEDFADSCPSLRKSSDAVSAEKHRIFSSQRHERIYPYRKRYQNVSSAKICTTTKYFGECKGARTSDRIPKTTQKKQNERIHKTNAPHLNYEPLLYHENKIQNLQQKSNSILYYPFSSADTSVHLSSSSKNKSSNQLLSRKEFLYIQNAFNQMEEEVHSFEKKLMDYLSGKNSSSLKLKHSLTIMLGISEENFDELITTYFLMGGGVNNLRKHEDRFQKRLGEVYRLVLIGRTYGFIGLQSNNRLDSSVCVCSNEAKLQSSVSSDENSCVTKLRIELEEASLQLQKISEQIFAGVQWIHNECPSVPKRKESHLMCVKIGLTIAERIRKARRFKATMRAFVAWKLESLLRHNRLKVLSFKSMLSQGIFYRLLTAKMAQMLKLRFSRWRQFLKLKQREERVASSMQLQRAWRGFAGWKHLRSVRIELLAMKLQCTVRVYRLRHLLHDLRIELRKSHAAINLQKVSRRFLSLQSYETIMYSNRKTVQLQGFIRLSISKSVLIGKRLQKSRNQILIATIIVQQLMRKLFSVRIKNDLKLKKHVALVQCLWRRFDSRKTYSIVKVAVTLQKLARRIISKMEREKAMFALVVRIQNTIRSFSARTIRMTKYETNARRKIQSFVAIVRAQKVVQRKLKADSARTLQRCMTRYRMKVEQHQKTFSAILMQRMYRLRAARTLLKQQIKAKNRVVLLRHIQHRKLLHRSVFTLQKRLRMVQAINKLNRIRTIRLLVIELQKRSRRIWAKRCLERARAFDRSDRNNAANKIQFIFRRFLRLNLKQLPICIQKKTASIVMQQFIRRMISMNIKQNLQIDRKKRFATHHASASTIQSIYRSYIIREALTKIHEYQYQERVRLKVRLFSKIQSCYRLKLAKTISTKLRQQRRILMALRIQGVIRSRQAKRSLLKLMRESSAKRIENFKYALVVTQSWWRVVVAKSRLHQMLSLVRRCRKHPMNIERLGSRAQQQDERLTPEESALDANKLEKQFHRMGKTVPTAPVKSPENNARQESITVTVPLIIPENISTFEEREDTACSSKSRLSDPRIGDWIEQFMTDIKSRTFRNGLSGKDAVSDQVSGKNLNKRVNNENMQRTDQRSLISMSS